MIIFSPEITVIVFFFLSSSSFFVSTCSFFVFVAAAAASLAARLRRSSSPHRLTPPSVERSCAIVASRFFFYSVNHRCHRRFCHLTLLSPPLIAFRRPCRRSSHRYSPDRSRVAIVAFGFTIVVAKPVSRGHHSRWTRHRRSLDRITGEKLKGCRPSDWRRLPISGVASFSFVASWQLITRGSAPPAVVLASSVGASS